MEGLLSFLSDLILFTAGIIISFVWVIIIVGVSVEIFDLLFRRNKGPKNEEEL